MGWQGDRGGWKDSAATLGKQEGQECGLESHDRQCARFVNTA